MHFRGYWLNNVSSWWLGTRSLHLSTTMFWDPSTFLMQQPPKRQVDRLLTRDWTTTLQNALTVFLWNELLCKQNNES
jgi:hypothetical protein